MIVSRRGYLFLMESIAFSDLVERDCLPDFRRAAVAVLLRNDGLTRFRFF
jgi:hypothetical protein